MTPSIESVVETVIYADDLPRAVDFYKRVMGLTLQMSDDRFAAFTVAAGQVLLIFLRGVSREGVQTSGGWIPPHDGIGPQHFAFGTGAEDLEVWAARLTESGVAIESRVGWPRGARSLFFRDPDGHLVELVTPGAWVNY